MKAGLLGRWQGCRGGAEPRPASPGVSSARPWWRMREMVGLVYLTTTLQPARPGPGHMPRDLPASHPLCFIHLDKVTFLLGDEWEQVVLNKSMGAIGLGAAGSRLSTWSRWGWGWGRCQTALRFLQLHGLQQGGEEPGSDTPPHSVCWLPSFLSFFQVTASHSSSDWEEWGFTTASYSGHS